MKNLQFVDTFLSSVHRTIKYLLKCAAHIFISNVLLLLSSFIKATVF